LYYSKLFQFDKSNLHKTKKKLYRMRLIINVTCPKIYKYLKTMFVIYLHNVRKKHKSAKYLNRVYNTMVYYHYDTKIFIYVYNWIFFFANKILNLNYIILVNIYQTSPMTEVDNLTFCWFSYSALGGKGEV